MDHRDEGIVLVMKLPLEGTVNELEPFHGDAMTMVALLGKYQLSKLEMSHS